MPRNLEETYRRTIQSIPENRKNDAIRLLQFLVYSEQPLTLAVAKEVIATRVEDEPRGFDAKRRLFHETDVLLYCPSLVTVVRAYETQLHLAHLSVKEYLLGENQFNVPTASSFIARTCLAYLTDMDGDYKAIRPDFPMAGYAVEAWAGHAALAQASEETVRATVEFLENEATFQRWTRYYGCDIPWALSPGYVEGSRLYYACCIGLVATAQYFIGKGADVNAQGGYYGNALQAASAKGHQEVVKLLLDKGADVNAQGGASGNPLQAALAEDYQEVVKILLENGADVSAQCGMRGYPLQAASLKGWEEIVELLLDKGADVNTQDDSDYGNALQAASAAGHQEVVKLLLENGADVNAQCGLFGYALQAASFGGYEQIVKLLFDKGADVNAQGGIFGYPLQAASWSGHQEIVELLLDKGADVNAQDDNHYGNALHHASVQGHQEIVRLLLDKGADINAPGNDGRNPLHGAIERGKHGIVKLLLDRGADINTSTFLYRNALHAAMVEGQQEIVELLQARGALPFERSGSPRPSNSAEIDSLMDYECPCAWDYG